MIRALILWFAKRLLAKYVSGPLAERIVAAASAAFDEIKARGENAEGAAKAADAILPPNHPDRKLTVEDIARGNPS